MKLKNVHTFRINYTPSKINLNDFICIIKNICLYLSDIQILEISFSSYLDSYQLGNNDNLNRMTECLINLKSLCMTNNHLVNDTFLIELSKKCKQLSNVDISGKKYNFQIFVCTEIIVYFFSPQVAVL